MELDIDALALCLRVARQEQNIVDTKEDANILRAASKMLVSTFPVESEQLNKSSEGYFEQYPDNVISVLEVVHLGWIKDPPGFLEMLKTHLESNKDTDGVELK